jgi:Domain of unknown function (DUF4328)
MLRWVAEPPPGTPGATKAPIRFRTRYAGPPRYRVLPRWGFPVAPWRPPGNEPPPPPAPLRTARSLVGTLVPLLWATAVVAFIASCAEVWRYVLLLASRDGALPAPAVAASDALVVSAGRIAPVLTVVSGGLLILWSVRAYEAAADRAGVRPARSTRWIVIGWLVPGLNMSVPGSVLAEIEHSALGRPSDARPRPSRFLLLWWALWAAGVVLSAVVLLWSLRTGVQALADGVVQRAVLDLLAAVTAVVTARLVVMLTRLLAPMPARRREVLVKVSPS